MGCNSITGVDCTQKIFNVLSISSSVEVNKSIPWSHGASFCSEVFCMDAFSSHCHMTGEQSRVLYTINLCGLCDSAKIFPFITGVFYYDASK